jgi:hypothetical protein
MTHCGGTAPVSVGVGTSASLMVPVGVVRPAQAVVAVACLHKQMDSCTITSVTQRAPAVVLAGVLVVTGGAVSAGTVAAGAVSAGTVAAGAVSAGMVAAGTVSAGTVAAGAVSAGTVAAGAVSTGTVAAGAVSAGTVAAGIAACMHPRACISSCWKAAGMPCRHDMAASTVWQLWAG